MKREEFELLVKQALSSLPKKFAQKLENVAIMVEDYPSQEQLAQLGFSSQTTLFGLYEGIAKPKRSRGYTMVVPDKITIFRGPIENLCHTPEEIKKQVLKTVLHEIAHHFGMNERKIQETLT